jgi:tetratricopeptide (TPR) repeat protein
MKVVLYGLMCCFVTLSVATGLWGAEGEKMKTPEQKAWEEVDSLNKQSLQDFLMKFPDGELAKQAKVAVELHDKFSSIKEGKSKGAFIISLDVLGERWKGWQKRNPDKGVLGYFVEKKGEKFNTLGWFSPTPLSGGKTGGRGTISFDERGILTSPTGDGSIIAFRTGGLKFELFNGIVFETPGDEPMYFGVIEGKGVVHIYGKGKVSTPDGKETVLDSRWATLDSATMAMAKGDWKSLIQFAKNLKSDSQNELIASHMLTFAYLMEGRYNDNFTEARECANKGSAGGQLSRFYQKLLSEFPNSEYLFLALGDAYFGEGNLPEAVKAFENSIQINNKNPHIYSMLGAAKRNAGQTDEAIDLYRKAISLDNKFAPAYANLGAAYLFQKKFSEAETFLSKAVEIRPDYALAWVNLGLVLRNQGSLDKAIACYDKAISLVPENPQAYKNLGAAYAYKGDYNKARLAWERTVELDPKGLEGASARRNLARLPK